MPFVVDASVAIKWVVAEPGSRDALALLDDELVAPDLLMAECTNTLWRLARQGILSKAGTEAALTFFAGVPITLVPTRSLMPRAFDMAFSLEHPAYECLYLALAERRGLVCLTADTRFHGKVASSEWAALVAPASPG